MNIKIKQGEDIFINLPVTNENNEIVDILNAEKVRMSIYIKNQHIISFMDLSLEGSLLSGYKDMEVATGNELNIVLTRDITKNFPTGEMKAIVLVEETGSNLSLIRNEYSFVIGTVEEGFMKDETL